MDPDICQPGLAELAQRAKQLRARHVELTADLDQPPAAPSPPSCARFASTSATSSPTAPPKERKSRYEALIDHIEITSDDTIVPVYRVPTTADPTDPPPTGRNTP